MQPAADVAASRPAAPDNLVVAAPTAEIARPARFAGLLPVDMPRCQPVSLAGKVNAAVERAHRANLVSDKTVAGRKFAFGGNAEVAGAGAAGIGAMRSAVDSCRTT